MHSVGYEDLAFGDGLAAIGWDAVGDLTLLAEQSLTRDAVQAAFPLAARESIRIRTDQLFQFHVGMAKGDLVVLLRRSGTDVAVGQITGEYRYRHDLESGVRHVRPVRWKRTDLPRSSVMWLLLDMPTLMNIYRVEEKDSFARLIELAESDVTFGDTLQMQLGPKADELTPFANLKRNLEYARSLAQAGEHLDQLDTRSFKVADMFRAAWVQGVAALDYWVRQEVRAQMLWLANRPEEPRPRKFSAFSIPLGDVEKILRSESSLSAVIDDQLILTRGHMAYQHPDNIRDAFSLVNDVKGMWDNVAGVLSEQLEGIPVMTGSDVQRKLANIVMRRNKIAHESDDDPDSSPLKRSIDVSAVTETIDWIEQLAAAIAEVLGLHARSD
jgi:restriction system protein